VKLHGCTVHLVRRGRDACLPRRRQGLWNGFTQFTLWGVIFVVVLLVEMAVFLL
jgi:hypothetical protein